jgi:S-adenosylmethionine uptake transporter
MSPIYATDHARPIVPFAVATAAILLFTTMDGVVKGLPLGLPVIEVVAMRYLFGIPLVFLAMWRTGAGWPTLSSWKANTPRGILNVVSLMLFFTALRRLPFAETLLAALLLGERLHARILGAVLLGLAGVGVIAWDTLSGAQALSGDLIGIAAVSGSAVTYALNNVMLRSQAQRDAATSIVLIQHVVPSLVALPFAMATWQTPSASTWFVFPLVAAFGVTGHFLLTWAYGRAQAGVLAPVDYLALPYAALLGFVFFAEVPTVAVWAGAALIVAACLIITGLRK